MSSPLRLQGSGTRDRPRIIAFISPGGGSGRTSAVVNVAWILASARKRILILDWGTEAPWAHEYLRPFYLEEHPIADALGEELAAVYEAVMPATDSTSSPALKRHDLPQAVGQIDVVGAPEAITAAIAEGHASGVVTALRERLRTAGYDYVLIDSPTDTSDAVVARIALLSDVAVVCFSPRRRAITEALALARRVREHTSVGIEIVPAPTQFERREHPRAKESRSAIHAAFAEFHSKSGGPEPSVPVVEIPYQPFDVFDELLTVLVDDPHRPTSLRAAYEGLAGAVTKGTVTALSPMPRAIRARYLRGTSADVDLESAEEPDRIVIASAARDRAWADWVRGQLKGAGAQVRSLGNAGAWMDAPEPPGLVVISSPCLEESRVGNEIAALMARLQDEARSITAVQLRIADGAPRAAVPNATLIDIVGRSEPQARVRLLTYFGLIGRPGSGRARASRYPTAVPRLSNLPSINPHFAGRNDEVEALRDRLLESNGRPTTLSGAPGIGKSELALEYAHRFAFDYDLVWWVPAHDRQSLLAALSRLAKKLREGRAGDAATVLEALASGSPDDRWLLVYDNADDATLLAGLLPEGGVGHVLITARDTEPSERSSVMELDAFLPQDSARMLYDGVPGLSPDDARRVADAVNHLPLALHLAEAWVRETISAQRSLGATTADAAGWATQEILSRLESAAAEEPLPSEDPSGATAARAVSIATETLQETSLGRAAVLLAQLCAFLSPQGVDLRLLRSRAVLALLVSAGRADTEALSRDATEVDRMLWTGARFGLFELDRGRSGSVRVHRVAQAALREAMPPAERRVRRGQVLACLAAYAPTEVEDECPDWEARFAELQKHLVPSGALEYDDDAIRRWLVTQVRYLYRAGDTETWRTAIDQAHVLHERWTSAFGLGDQLRLRLAGQLANLHRALGHHEEALRLDDLALAGQRRSLPLTHPRVLLSASSRGGDLRGLGRFAEALEEDQATWEGLREALGEDHLHTRSAANNLARSMFLTGDVRGALALERDNYARRMRLFGPDDPDTWWSLCNIGAYLRELGDYDGARDALLTALQHIHRLRPSNHPDELRIQRHLAITERWLGRAEAAKERSGRTLRAFAEVLGEHHPLTLGCALTLAADHYALHEPERAVDLATDCLQRYERELGLDRAHPFVALCRVGLGLYLSASGALDEALVNSEAGWQALRTRLGEGHPWTLAAAIDHACVLAAAGDLKQAVELTRSTRDRCTEFLGIQHPYTRAADHNVNLTQDSAGTGAIDAASWEGIIVDVPRT